MRSARGPLSFSARRGSTPVTPPCQSPCSGSHATAPSFASMSAFSSFVRTYQRAEKS